jgi:integrase
VLDDAELRLFWSGIVNPPVSEPVGQGLRLALFTGARIGEIAGMAREELSHLDDDARPACTIPAERYKTGKPRLIRLTPTAREIVAMLSETPPDDDDAGRFLFPARSSAEASMLGVIRFRQPCAGLVNSLRVRGRIKELASGPTVAARFAPHAQNAL